MISSPITFILDHGIVISFPEEKKLNNFALPGTIILVIVPVLKSAVEGIDYYLDNDMQKAQNMYN